MIDLKSDTVTKPTEEMRRAMASAEVGDDVYGEDPTVNELEAHVAKLLGKEGAVFFPSATMSNLAGCMAHCHEGSMNEVLVGSRSHQALYEVGNLSTVGRVFPRIIPQSPVTGEYDLDEVRHALGQAPDVHCTMPRLICVENTNCYSGGAALPLSHIEKIREVAKGSEAEARGYSTALHCDGARLWHAAVAAATSSPKSSLLPSPADDGTPPWTVERALLAYAAPFDSVSVCLSKGLGAPVGSLLAGSVASGYLPRARHIRKMLGGGMRQAGIVAAGGLYALQHQLDRLGDDHRAARQLAAGINQIDGLRALPPQTNMVMFRTTDERPFAATFAEALKAEGGLQITYMNATTCRMVARLGVTDDEYRRVPGIVAAVWSAFRSRS